ncbi:MAG TPA: PAS domain S-box protein [Longimicrobiales bacterium]|nr:PAS domain S-box protein [Longimicrobiales bacterium]
MPVGNHPPLRALLISLAALAIPVAGAFWVPGALQDYEALLWMLAVVPAFLLAYYKAWRGAAVALAAAMAVVSVTYAVTQVVGRPMPDLMLAVLIIVIGMSLGIGALADRLQRAAGGERSGFTDPATGLPNRAHAELHLETEFSTVAGRTLSVVLFGVDNLKGYSTRHGAIVGDEVLRMIAEVLKKTTRRMNLSARYAEDEFLCVLSAADEEGAVAFVKRFMQTLQDFAGERPLPPLSGGIAAVKPAMKTHHELLTAARTALKQARKEGRGRIRVHGRPLNLPVNLQTAPIESKVETLPGQPDARIVMPEGRGRGRRVLIVAEETPLRVLLWRYLNDHGFDVTQASNIVDGVQLLATEYDLLFTDISLNEGIGTELVRAAKVRWPSIQVVGLVPETAGDLVIETLNAGVDRYLVTPLDLPRVRQHITELLERRDRLVASVLESRQLTMEYEARAQDAVTALRQTEEEYRTIVRSVHEVVFRTDVDGNFTFLNEAWRDVTGYAVESTLGRAAADYVHPDDRAEFISTMRALATGERAHARAELCMRAHDGSSRWLELRARRAFDADSNVLGVAGTLEDVTARRQAAEALRRSEAASRGLLAALPDEVMLISRTGVVLDQGPGAEGKTKSGQVGVGIDQVFPATVVAGVQPLIDAALETGAVQVFDYTVLSDGQVRELELRLAPSGEDAVVAVVRDITHRVQLEEQLRQSQKLEAIGRLAGGLAHDFNNLLTVIQGNAHLLSDEAQSRQAQEYLQQVDMAAERGATLVRQLLAFGRRQVLQPATVNLNALVEETRSMLTRLIGEHITLETELDPEIGLISADPGQVEQVLVNLAVNAREVIGESGRLRITTRNHALAIHGGTGASVDDVVLLTVTDNGPGMDAETLELVFEPFFTTKGLASASGLGLATVYGIVRQSGGTISVSSEPGQGTSFEIAFPRIDT